MIKTLALSLLLATLTLSAKDHYETLGVSRNASRVLIDAAYFQKKQTHAGDLSPDIEEAYAVLSNPVRKETYDRNLRESEMPSQKETREQHKADFIFEYKLNDKDPAVARKGIVEMLKNERARSLRQLKYVKDKHLAVALLYNNLWNGGYMSFDRYINDEHSQDEGYASALLTALSKHKEFLASKPTSSEILDYVRLMDVRGLAESSTGEHGILGTRDQDRKCANAALEACVYFRDNLGPATEKEFLRIFERWDKIVTRSGQEKGSAELPSAEEGRKWADSFAARFKKSPSVFWKSLTKRQKGVYQIRRYLNMFSNSVPAKALLETIKQEVQKVPGYHATDRQGYESNIDYLLPILKKLYAEDPEAKKIIESYGGWATYFRSYFSGESLCRYLIYSTVRK